MVGKLARLFSSATTTLLLPVIVLLVYFLLQGNQAEAVHVFRQDRFVYISLGEYGAFQFYELRNVRPLPGPVIAHDPNSPLKKISWLREPIDKSQRIVSEISGQVELPFGDVSKVVGYGALLLAVNPNTGIIIFNNTNPLAPNEITRIPFYGVKDITFFEQLAFVSAGVNGVYILDLTRLPEYRIIGHFDTTCTALKTLPLRFEISELESPDAAESGETTIRKIEQFLAYVACGERGFLVLDFKNKNLTSRRLVELHTEDTPGYVHDIFFEGSYLFVADGDHGIRIYDTFGNDPSQTVFLGGLDTPGEAIQVVLHHGKMVVADGRQGVFIARFEKRPEGAVFSTIANIPVIGSVNSIAISKDLAVLGLGNQGVKIIDLANPSRPATRFQVGMPGLASIGQIANALQDPRLRSANVWASIIDMATEFSFALVALLIAILALIPFTQPVLALKSYLASFGQFFRYLLGGSGRAVFVENAQVLSTLAMQDVSSARPIILDNASAGLVMGEEGKMGVIGPGANLLQPQEALVKLADLRPRTFIFGPAREDPFEPQQESEDEQMVRQRLRRRAETSALTRDGFELVPNIVIDFHIKAHPEARTAPFGFHPAYSLQALSKDYSANKIPIDSSQGGDLDRLPGELALQAWRYYLSCFSLAELFTPLKMQERLLTPSAVYGLGQVVQQVNQHLTQQYIEDIEPGGRPTGQRRLSEAYNQLEQAGLEVQRVWIVNIRLAPGPARAFLEDWLNSWPEKIAQDGAALEARYREIQGVNRQRGLVEFVRSAMQPLQEGMQRYRELPDQFLYLNRSLYLLIRGTRSMSRISPSDKLQLEKILEWLEGNLDT